MKTSKKRVLSQAKVLSSLGLKAQPVYVCANGKAVKKIIVFASSL